MPNNENLIVEKELLFKKLEKIKHDEQLANIKTNILTLEQAIITRAEQIIDELDKMTVEQAAEFKNFTEEQNKINNAALVESIALANEILVEYEFRIKKSALKEEIKLFNRSLVLEVKLIADITNLKEEDVTEANSIKSEIQDLITKETISVEKQKKWASSVGIFGGLLFNAGLILMITAAVVMGTGIGLGAGVIILVAGLAAAGLGALVMAGGVEGSTLKPTKLQIGKHLGHFHEKNVRTNVPKPPSETPPEEVKGTDKKRP